MTGETERNTLLELPPREFVESLLTEKRFAEIDSQIAKVITPDFGRDLIDVPPSGERSNWRAKIKLAGIFFGKEIKEPPPEDARKGYKYKIEVPVTNEDNTTTTVEINARMVGQILQKLIAHAEAAQKFKDHPSETQIVDRARRAAIRHIKVAIEKHEDSQTEVEGLDGKKASQKKVMESVGISEFPGEVDKVNCKQILHILKAIEQRSQNISPEDRQKNDILLRTDDIKVILS